jgi:membrane protein YdbS with pleckstrin-like domain
MNLDPVRPPAPGPAATEPPPADPELRPLDPRAVSLWRIAALARAGLLTAAAIVVDWAAGQPIPLALAAALVAGAGIAWAIAVPPLRYRSWGFALRDDDLFMRRGILFRTTSIVPFARIQHVDTRHGPVDRWLGLAAVVVYTAGTRGAILDLPALDAGEAESMRDRLAGLSGVGDAV